MSELLHATFRDSQDLRAALAECEPALQELCELAPGLPGHTDGSLRDWAEKHIAPAQGSLQVFPTEFGGQVVPCLALCDGAAEPAGLRVEHKHGLRFVPLNQDALGEAAVPTWAEMLEDSGRRFRELPAQLAREAPELHAASVNMTLFQDDARMLKFHTIQPEINTRTGPQMNPDWLATGGGRVWTLSAKHCGRECFKVACRDGKPYVIPFNPLSPFYNTEVDQGTANEAFGDAHFCLGEKV